MATKIVSEGKDLAVGFMVAGKDECIREYLCEDEMEAIAVLRSAVLESRRALVEPYPDGDFHVFVKMGR